MNILVMFTLSHFHEGGGIGLAIDWLRNNMTAAFSAMTLCGLSPQTAVALDGWNMR